MSNKRSFPSIALRNKMAPLCCIIPQDLLQQVIDKGEAPQDVIDSCAVTIEETKSRREARIQYRQSILSAQQQNVPEGIIPNFIHEALAQSAATADLRQASLDTLAARVRHRPAPGAGDHNLNRTVYDAHNSTGRKPPRDRVLIKEGGISSPRQQIQARTRMSATSASRRRTISISKSLDATPSMGAACLLLASCTLAGASKMPSGMDSK